MKPHIKTLIEGALLAPSGDNLQPWRIIADGRSDRIGIILDKSRDQSPMNSGYRMSRIAIGAMIENLVQLAEAMGLVLDIKICPENNEFLVIVSVSGEVSGDGADIASKLASRVSNRKAYDGNPVPEDMQKKLLAATAGDEGMIHWVFEKKRLELLGELIGRSDACMFNYSKVRKSFVASVRFDLPSDAGATHGLSSGSLELSSADIIGVRMFKFMPDFLYNAAKVGDKFINATKNLIHSSSGLCLIRQTRIEDREDILLGQRVQRVWLLLSGHGFAVQPMNSLVVLSNMIYHDAVPYGTTRLLILELLKELSENFSESGDSHPGFIFRFGYAAPPTAKNGRLPFAEQVIEGTVE
jgi:hypothetical protein